MVTPTRVAIAGSTGSIGTQTLEVIRAEGPDRYDVVGLGAGSSTESLIEQAREFRPTVVAVADEARRAEVAAALPDVEVVAEQSDLIGPADVVINGVVGFAGLGVTVETLRAGKRLGLANKESLIAAGRARMRAILLTTITTVLGLTPLILETSFQAKFLIPMAISLAAGLIAATMVVLLIVPCFLLIFDDIKEVAHLLWHGNRRPETSAVEPVVAPA